MSDERYVRSAEISVFAHATEDEDKVKQALGRVLRGIEPTYEISKLSGHYNDPIHLLTIKLTKRKESTELLKSVFERLSTIDKATIKSELDKRVDASGNLYLRLDKQRAYNGSLVLQENDPIRVKFKMQFPHGVDAVVTLREYLTQLEDGDTPD